MPTALITGTSTGIGRATALHFADQGYRVFAAARKPEVVPQHANLIPVQLDIDSDASVKTCVEQVLAQGRIDVLVNNAGIGMRGAVEMVPLDRVRALFETNFFGAVRMLQAVLPSMREQAGGTVVNVTSMMGHVTLGCHGYYSATKFALAAISESLAIEARPFGIKVAIIEPGVVVTPIFGKSAPTMPENHPYQQAMARLTRVLRTQLVDGAGPEIVANAIFNAVAEGCVKLRYPVGPDAEVIAATHDRMTPAEWAALLSEPDDEKFLAAAEQAFGVDLFNPPSLYKRTAGDWTPRL